MDPAYRFSGIGRPVDPVYPSNRAIAALASVGLLVGAVWGILGGVGWIGALWSGLNCALTVFLTWALTRELSPDDGAAAFVGVGVVVVAWFVLGRQSLVVPVTLLLALRLVNRSTGKAAELTDALFFLPLFGYATWFVSWTLGVTTAAALALDARLPVPEGQSTRKHHLALGLALLLVAGARRWSGAPGLELPEQPLLLLGLAAAAGMVALAYPMPRSRGDVDEELLRPSRVQGAMLLGVLGTLGVTLDAGIEAAGLAIAWSGLAGIVVGFPLLRRRRS